MVGPQCFSSGDGHTKGLLFQLYLGLEGIPEVDNDPKGKFVFFKVTPSNDIVLSVHVPSGYSTREQLDRGSLFEGLQNYIKNKNKGNENKIILGDFNCTMNKMNRDGENKRQRLYRYCSSYSLPKPIVDNELEDLNDHGERGNLDSY